MENEIPSKLIFVYNAHSGLRNGWMDVAHKLISPATYQCSLCNLTHGAFKERRLWKSFRQESEVNMEFLHKDEFRKQYGSKFGHPFTFPAILCADGLNLEMCVSTKELNGMRHLEELIDLLRTQIGDG